MQEKRADPRTDPFYLFSASSRLRIRRFLHSSSRRECSSRCKSCPADFLVTDGHHNRVYFVTLDGEVSEVIAFNNIVPTGLVVSQNKIYMAEAGPVPHLPKDGKIVVFRPNSSEATTIASGGPLLVGVELDPRNRLYGLAQGKFPEGGAEGDPALPNTGALMVANANGRPTALVRYLDQPTSFLFIGESAYVVGLAGDIWKIDNVSCPTNGPAH